MNNKYNFDLCPNRENTGSLKWDKYKNQDIIPLWVADMDFTSPPEVMNELNKRIEHGIFGYTVPYDSLFDSISNYLSKKHNYKIQRNWVQFLPGLVCAINLCCRAFLGKDDSVMTTTPIYPPFLSAPQYSNKKLITVPLIKDKDSWTFDFNSMEEKINKNTKLFILCNPHNPIGKVYNKEELENLSLFCEKHDLILVSDEIHCDLIFNKSSKHIMSANLNSELANRTITLMSPSKTYNIPGLSCAFAIIENHKIRQIYKNSTRGIINEINCFGYVACEAAYKFGENWRVELLDYLKKNYILVKSFFETNIPQIELNHMDATYLAWLRIDSLGLEAPIQFFEKNGVGLSDGKFFGDSNYIRLNFGCPKDRLFKGLERIQSALKKEGLI